MKHRATIDLEFINGEIFEQEVLKAMRSSAKNIARDAVQKEVEQCVKNTVRLYLQNLSSTHVTSRMVKMEVAGCIKNQIGQTDIQEFIIKTIQDTLFEIQKRTVELTKSEVEKYISNSFVDAAIQQTVKEVVPDKVKEILFKNME